MNFLIQFKNLSDIDKALKDEKTCRLYYEQIRWEGKPVCPHCGNDRYYTLTPSKKQNEYKCANNKCYKKFNCLTLSIFDNTKISLIIWFKAIHLCSTLSKGISSVDLAKTLGLTQKTAWFLLHRIREVLKEKAPVILEGDVEIDEAWIGGKDIYKHEAKRTGRGNYRNSKAPIIGMVERGGKLIMSPIRDDNGDTVMPIVASRVKAGSQIYTDKSFKYRGAKNMFSHESVDHHAGEYVRGQAYTNTVEGAFGLFKRKVNAIHHWVSPKHLSRYCVEFSFFYNARKLSAYDKFLEAIRRCDTRLLYKELIAD